MVEEAALKNAGQPPSSPFLGCQTTLISSCPRNGWAAPDLVPRGCLSDSEQTWVRLTRGVSDPGVPVREGTFLAAGLWASPPTPRHGMLTHKCRIRPRRDLLALRSESPCAARARVPAHHQVDTVRRGLPSP